MTSSSTFTHSLDIGLYLPLAFTSDVTHLCDQCTFATTDIDVLLRHYEGCHTLISLKGAPPQVKAEDEAGGEKETARGGEREYSCTKCTFVTEVEEEIFRHYR